MLAMLVFTTSLTTSESLRSYVLLSPSLRRLRFWIKEVVRAKDSQGAWMAFRTHYLRTSQLNGIAEQANQCIESLIYSGEKTHYNFKVHVSNFKKVHLDLAKAGNEPDGCTKVQKFLQSIKALKLQTAVGMVKNQDIYLMDFKATINYLHHFVSPMQSSHNVSAMGASSA